MPRSFDVTETRSHAYTGAGRIQLVRTDRIAARFWRRSQAEKAARAYQDLGYGVEIAKELRAWPRDCGRYAVLVSGKKPVKQRHAQPS